MVKGKIGFIIKMVYFVDAAQFGSEKKVLRKNVYLIVPFYEIV